MSTSYINAQEAKKNIKEECKEMTLTLYFGIFFDSTDSNGKGRELSRLYRNKYHKESEKSYSISSTIVQPEFLLIYKDDKVLYDERPVMELYSNAGQAVECVLSSVLDVVSGYAGSYNLKLEFDIYGLDSGTIAAYAMGHIIEPDKDGFEEGCKELIFGEISDAHINTFRNLVYKKEVNHFVIAETKAAIRRQKEITQTAIDAQVNEGYVIHASIQETSGIQTEIEQHGFTKQDINDWLDNTQATLDGLGMVDLYGIGPVADAINMIISLGRGKWAAAGLSLFAILPIIGNYAIGPKIAKNSPGATKILKEGDELPDNVIDGTKKFEQKMKADREKMIEEMSDNNVAQISDYKTVYSSVGRVSGGNGGYGNYGWGESNVNKRYNSTAKSNSVWDKVKPVEEVGELIPLRKAADSSAHGQQRIIDKIKAHKLYITVMSWLRGGK